MLSKQRRLVYWYNNGSELRISEFFESLMRLRVFYQTSQLNG